MRFALFPANVFSFSRQHRENCSKRAALCQYCSPVHYLVLSDAQLPVFVTVLPPARLPKLFTGAMPSSLNSLFVTLRKQKALDAYLDTLKWDDRGLVVAIAQASAAASLSASLPIDSGKDAIWKTKQADIRTFATR